MTSGPKLDSLAAIKMARELEPLVAGVTGPVVQVGELAVSYGDGAQAERPDLLPAGPVDNVVLVFQLGQGLLEERDLVELAGRMSEGSRLYFVEPVCGVGLGRTMQKALATRLRRKYGWDFETDAPALIRGSGFEVITVERFVYGPSAMVHTFAAGIARISSR